MSSKKQVILRGLMGKLETPPYGSGGSVAGATDGILMAEYPELNYDFLFKGEHMNAIASGAPYKQVAPKGRTGSAAIQVVPRGAGAAYSASVVPFDAHVLLQLAGHSATGSFGAGVESWTYKPISSAWSSGYLEAYSRGQKWPLVGVYSDFEILIEQGKLPRFIFPIQGRLDVTPTDVALPAITYNTAIIPPAGANLAVTIGNYTSTKCRRLHFRKHQDINPRADISSVSPVMGHAGFGMGRRAAELELLIEADTLTVASPWSAAATLNPYEMLAGGYAAAGAQPPSVSVSWTVASAQYNRYTWTGAQCYLKDVSEAEDGAAAMWLLRFLCTTSTPVLDDDYTLVFN